ncbi:MAG: pyrroline-5-carboxylate reductase family protein, partial [Nitrospirales bacterium]
MVLDGKQIAFLGAGNMTEALVAGLLKAGLARPKQLRATDVLPQRRAHLQARYHLGTGADNVEAARWGQILVFAVEPQVLDEVLGQVQSVVRPDALLVSVAAGFPLARVARQVPANARL